MPAPNYKWIRFIFNIFNMNKKVDYKIRIQQNKDIFNISY